MKIVLLPAPPYREIGGVATHVYMLAKGLNQLGECTYLVQGTPQTWFRVPFIRIPEIIIAHFSLYFSRRFRRWIEDFYFIVNALWQTNGKIDILNIQNVQHASLAMILKKLTGCRTVLTVHGYLTYEAETRNWCNVGDKTHQWLWNIEKNGYKRFDAIVCVAKKTVKYVEKFAPHPITLIHNGLDTEAFKPAFEKDKRTILFSGALQEAKGIFDVLKVIQILVENNRHDLFLRVAGTGPQEIEARKYVLEHGLSENVTFLGLVQREKMVEFYQSGALLIFASKQAGITGKSEESFPYSVLEAMACGLPVIAYRTGGLHEQIQDGVNGYLVDSGDTDVLFDRALALFNDEDLRGKMGKAARNICVDNFSNISMAKQYLDVYLGDEVENNEQN